MKPIPQTSLIAAMAILQPYCPALSPVNLVEALKEIESPKTDRTQTLKKKYITIDEAASILGVTRVTINNYAKIGKIKKTNLGKRAARIELESIEKLLTGKDEENQE